MKFYLVKFYAINDNARSLGDINFIITATAVEFSFLLPLNNNIINNSLRIASNYGEPEKGLSHN